jgi:two-component system, OmpR family, sensor kinase
MRRRLTIAMVLLVALTLLATGVVSYYFIERAAISTAQQELAGQGQAISTTLSEGTAVTRMGIRRELAVMRQAGDFDAVDVVALHSNGSLTGTFPGGVTASDLDVAALQQGRQVSGRSGTHFIYTAVPTPLASVTQYTPVLIISRSVNEPASGLRYFALVGLVALVLAALVAAALARRFTKPLVAAVATTRRIAAGDLDATVEHTRGEDPEFAELAGSINSMGATLQRAREQERQFLLSVSHELRTPLTSIRGYADAIVDGTAEQPPDAAGVISAESRRLERLVEDLLDLARLDADRFSLDLVAVDAGGAVRQVVEGFRPSAGELGLDLVAAPGSTSALWVRADADRLVQVLANLVENAASFAATQIVVGAAVVEGVPSLWVVDDGPGIPAEQLGRVFERHFVSDRVSGRRKGSGLGLAIVAELVGAMGGTVEAESPVVEGRGARIVLRLPPAAAPSGGSGASTPLEVTGTRPTS